MFSEEIFPSRSQFFMPIEQVFNKIYDDLLSDKSLSSMVKSKAGYPKLDIYTLGNDWIIECSCPGLEDDQISAEIFPDEKTGSRFVSISGSSSNEVKDAQYLVKELTKSAFKRIVRLPDNIKGEPEAKLNNGILKLTFKNSVLKNEKKLIPIKK